MFQTKRILWLCLVLAGMFSPMFATEAQAQNYSLSFSPVPNSYLWAPGSTHTTVVTVTNNGSTTIPAGTALYIENRMYTQVPGRSLTPVNSVTFGAPVTLIAGSCVSTSGAYARVGCRGTLSSALAPGATFTATYTFSINTGGGNLPVGGSNSLLQSCGTGWLTTGGPWSFPGVPLPGWNFVNSVGGGGSIGCVPQPQNKSYRVTKTGGGTVLPGGQVTFTLTARNAGSGLINSVTVSDTLLSNLSGIIINNGVPSANWNCSVVGQTASCTYIGPPVPTGQNFLPAITIKATASTQIQGPFTNCANVVLNDGPGTNVTTTNQRCRGYNISDGLAKDISITKTVSGATPVGGIATFTLNPFNVGPGAVSAIVVADILPPSLTFVSINVPPSPNWTNCQVNGFIVSCQYVGPQAGAGQPFLPALVLKATANTAGTYNNCVYNILNEGSTPDANPSNNNNICVPFTVSPPPPTGSITIEKDALPNDAQDFTFTTTVPSGSTFTLDDDSAPPFLNQRTFSGLTAGNYTFTETATSGWSLTGLTCGSANVVTNMATRTVVVTLPAGSNVVCKFTNTKQGSITIIKDAQPDGAQDFSFSSTTGTIVPFALDDDSDPTLSNTKVISNLNPGAYTFTEGVVSGWTLSQIVCTPGTAVTNTGNRTATVTLLAGANVTCTFINRQPGSITLIKDAQPNDAQDFPFTSNQSSIAPFSLDDDSDPTLSNQKVFTNLPSSLYSFTEGTVPGWALAALTCSPSTNATYNGSTVSINLAPGEDVVCIFTNVKQTGSITIVKDAQPNAAQDFPFTSGQSTIAPFSLDDDSDPALPNQKVFSNLPAGNYSFTEGTVAGWTLASIVCTPAINTTSSGSTVNIGLTAGANVVCTFINTQQSGTLTIVKDAQPHDPQDFHFVTQGAGLTDFDLDDDSDASLPNTKTFIVTPGVSYTVTEAFVGGWITNSIQCVVAVPGGTTTLTDTVQRQFTVNLTPGANVTCTFTNVKQTGSITIVKDAQPNDAQDFSFTSNQSTIPGFLLDDDNDPSLSNQKVISNLPASTYTFTEGAVAGWTLANISCSPSANTSSSGTTLTVNLTAGATVVCTFINTQQSATLTIVKDAQPNDPQDFHFTTQGTGLTDFDLDDDSDATLSNTKTFTVTPGVAYTVTETAVSGWTTNSIQCIVAIPGGTTTFTDTAPRLFTVNLTPGANVTCTFTNQKQTGSITIVKDAQPNDAQDFQFTSNQSTIPGFFLDDDSDATLSNQRVISSLPAGTYSFTESSIAGWTLAGISCTPSANTSSAGTTVTVNLAAGANVVCTFTNALQTATLTIVKDAQPNDPQDFHFTTQGAGLIPFDLDDDSDATLSNTKTFTVTPGVSYTVTETAVTGWTTNSIQCIVAIPGGTTTMTDTVQRLFTVNLTPGANVTCTFTNLKQLGSLTIIKDASPNSPQDFHFVVTGTGLTDFDLDDDGTNANPLSNSITFSNLAPGNYTVFENAVAGWTVSSIVYTGVPPFSNWTPSANGVNLSLAAGSNVTYTFTNVNNCAGSGYFTQGNLCWMPVVTTAIAWSQANTACTTATINGQTGWRLPTQTELQALVASQAFVGQGWTLDWAWSSTVNSGTSNHIAVNLFTGGSTAGGPGSGPDTSLLYYTCVHP